MRCVGVAEQVELYMLGQEVLVDLHVMPARPRAYPLILGRPWFDGYESETRLASWGIRIVHR